MKLHLGAVAVGAVAVGAVAEVEVLAAGEVLTAGAPLSLLALEFGVVTTCAAVGCS